MVGRRGRAVVTGLVIGTAGGAVMGGSLAGASHNGFARDNHCSLDQYADPHYFWRHGGSGGSDGRRVRLHEDSSNAYGNCELYVQHWIGGGRAWAAIYLPTNSNYNGDYRVQVWVPCHTHHGGEPLANGLRIHRYADGSAGGITETYIKYYQLHCDTVGSSLLEVTARDRFNGQAGGYLRITNETTTNAESWIPFDFVAYTARH